jgi:hypothetical protein
MSSNNLLILLLLSETIKNKGDMPLTRSHRLKERGTNPALFLSGKPVGSTDVV